MRILEPLLRALLGPAPSAAGDGVSPDEVRRALRTVLEGDEYQGSLPGSAGWEVPRHEPGWLEWLLDKLGVDALPERILLYFLVALSAIVLLLLVLWIVREVLEGRRGAASGIEEPGSGGPAGGSVPTFEGAQALARDGRFTEAVHNLLLAAQHLLFLRTRAVASPALTSREILRVPAIPKPAGRELSALVLAVEVSRFGGADVDGPDYERCLDHYERFSGALGGGRDG